MKKVLWISWLVLSAGVAAVGFRCIWSGFAQRQAWRQAAAAVPAAFPVDLGATGKYSAPFAHTCPAPYVLDVELVVEPPFASHQEAVQALAGLQAALFVGEVHGDTGHAITIGAEGLHEWPWSHSGLREIRSGTYFHYYRSLGSPRTCEVTLTVMKPAAGLAGRRQRLVLRYGLCGVETDIGPPFMWCVGGAFVLPFLVTGIIVLRRRFAKRGSAASTDLHTQTD